MKKCTTFLCIALFAMTTSLHASNGNSGTPASLSGKAVCNGKACTIRPLATAPPNDAEAIIRKNIADFSANLVAGNYEAVVAAYTDDAKIFPPSRDILAGSDSIRQYWTPPANAKSRIVYHKVTPEEIRIVGDTAYDWGYYEGSNENEKGEKSNWRGKYVIVWKEVSPKVWKIYLDCWNRVAENP